MERPLRRKRAVMVVVSLSAAVVSVALFLVAVLPSWRARRVLTEIVRVQIGGSADALANDAPVFGELVRDNPECRVKDCDVEVRYSNALLRIVHLSPRTEFGASVHLRNGVVDGTSAGIGVYRFDLFDGQANGISVGTRTVSWWDSTEPYVRREFTPNGKPWWIVVTVGPRTTPDVKASAFRINLSCLTKFGGCRDARELQTTMWAQQ